MAGLQPARDALHHQSRNPTTAAKAITMEARVEPATVHEACRMLEERGVLQRQKGDYSELVIQHVHELLGCRMPADLAAFYRERVRRVADFPVIAPVWNERVGWRPNDYIVTQLLGVEAVPILSDGMGNLFGLDLQGMNDSPAVYFFDQGDRFAKPRWAAGSSLARFLLLMADHDRAYDEAWPADWWLSVDPDIASCPRAPPLWLA